MSDRHFLAFAGDPEQVRRRLSSLIPSRQAPLRLNNIFNSDDLVVFASPDSHSLILEEGRGVVLGRVFRGVDPAARLQALSLSESRHAAWSRGKALTGGLWGDYVAFLRDQGTVTVLRDPSGAIPLYHFEANGLWVGFTHEDMALDLGLGDREVDEEFLRQWLSFPFLRTSRTGLAGVKELLPGTSCTWQEGRLTEANVWTPWSSISPAPAMTDFVEAARRLRATALATVPAMVAGREPFVLQLSGGLDSSIVAACLASAGLPFSAANFVTSMPDGDERDYARIVASALGVPLAEVDEDPRPLDLEPRQRCALRPMLSPVLQPLNRALCAHAASLGVHRFVTGAGGDNLFCYLTTAAPVLDAARALGPRKAVSTLQDVAELGGCTIWTAAGFALRKWLTHGRRNRWKRDERFLAPAAVAAEPDDHPWLDAPPDALPGKIEHVASIVRAQHFLEPQYSSGEAILHPLLNQPLMELCISIPTWLWLRGGRNRAVARAAFAGLLPEEVLLRRTKGRLESMCALAYEANRERLADLLLGGELRKRRLIDFAQLEPYLRRPGPPRDVDYFRVFDLVSLETWLRSNGR